MFGRLITPLKARFEPNPQPHAVVDFDHEAASAEDFARDVLIEVMRNSVESLKEAEALKSKIEVMGEMHRIMIEDACTKDVFRELDGYLLIVNVLSILHAHFEMGGSETTQTEEGERLAFMLLAESLNGHKRNQYYFEKHVGYEALAQALNPLVKDRRTLDQTFGFILSVALDNFAMSSIFTTLRAVGSTDFTEYRARLGTIKHPGVLALLVTLLPEIPSDDTFLTPAVFTVTETLMSLNHRNNALLSSTPLFGPVFQRFLQCDVTARPVLQKLLKRLLHVGASNEDARVLLQHAARNDGSLDSDVLEVIRSGMKARWPAHFSLESSAALEVKDEDIKGLPSPGFTFMIWLRIESFPAASSHVIFRVRNKLRVLFQLSLRLDGVLELTSQGNGEMAVLQHAKILKGRWTHLAVVHHPHRAFNPTIRIFVDGVLHESRNWAYPRTDSSSQTVVYTVGDSNPSIKLSISWCVASSYMISLPIADDLPRLIQHLGPRYAAHFQAKDLVRFLTYEAATSLNIFLSSLVARRTGRLHQAVAASVTGVSPLMRAIRDGMGIAEDSFIFSINPYGRLSDDEIDESGTSDMHLRNGVAIGGPSSRPRVRILGDIVPVSQQSLDIALWRMGGSSLALRFVELASNPHELSRALGIFADSSRSSWQMSEDMEGLRAYDALAHILKSKSQLINVSAFETLFEFLGLNFRTPDLSVVINSLGYRALALDLEIWAAARPEIQRMHFEHFTTLLKISKYRTFNAKQRLSKFGVIRKFLFVLQTDWYGQDMVIHLVAALKVVAQACFAADETIKPLVSYLASNLHEDTSQLSSPRSIVSRLDKTHPREKAEQVLRALVSILTSPNHLSKFSAALPLTRICLLLLGDNPTPVIATAVLTLIGLALKASGSFTRKFELVSGWSVLKVVLPGAWDLDVQKVAFDILFGRVNESDMHPSRRTPSVACPYVIPAIISALDHGLHVVAQDNFDEEALVTESNVEPLLEELMELQTISPTFRQAFKSQQTTSLLVNAYSAFVANGSSVQVNRRNYVRILEKMNHFILSFTLDKVVNNSQKEEMMEAFHKAEILLSSQSPNVLPDQAVSGRMTGRTTNTAHTSIQILGERAYQKTSNRIREWRKIIIASERKRFRRTALDLREFRRHSEQSNEWRNRLYDDRGIWPAEKSLRSWVLDETEGPCRVRKKLEYKTRTSSSSVDRDPDCIVPEPDADAQSFIQIEAPPWAESYDFHPADADSEQQWLDDFAEDKLRRVRHELQSGDVIEAVSTVTRIVGVDSSPGLLILGSKCLYMLDGLVENEDGEVIDAHDAPRNLFSVPGSLLELDGKQRAQNWAYELLTSFSKKKCLFRDVALELYFKDCRSLLIVFPSKKNRQDISEKLSSFITSRNTVLPRSPFLQRTPLLGKMGAKVLSGFRDELSTAQRKWQAREISNFTYLSFLNQISGRTPGDATQYPVFPWVLADYSSETLDLENASTFRDLSSPMGALTEPRREAARQRYSNLQSVGEIPFHYGTHFSSSMIVCHFLIRVEPFTHMFKTLQGGDWDLPDRLFSDISRAYHSASEDQRGDVRELIPEFFTSPEFLQNSADLDFGIQQSTGEKIHDVKLPPWANDDPLLFIVQHRRALESDFISENLPMWIDLIWGYKQRDAESLNVFHPLSYEGSVDLDNIKDEVEREATVGIIHNFGQTPRKLFESPHPSRLMHGSTTLPLGTQFGIEEDPHLLVQSSRPASSITSPIAALVVDTISERVIPCQRELLCVPQYPHEQIGWGYIDQSIKLFVDRKVTQVTEAISCLCASFVDSDLFATGSSDSMLRLWRLARKDGQISMSQTHILRAHSGAIVCVATCRAWSIIVSGSEDGTAVIWDLNRAVYVRSIRHRDPETAGGGNDCSVRLVAINDSTGYIASCSSRKLCLHTINAYPIAVLDFTLSHPSDAAISSLAFHEREYSRLGILATGTSSGKIYLRTWTMADVPPGKKPVWKFFTIRSLQCREGPDGHTSGVTALQFVGETLFHGEESGKVFTWDLPE